MERSQEKVTIRNFQESDVSSKVDIINDKKNNKYLHYDLPLEYEKTLNWFQKIKENTNRLDLTILYDDQVVGFIGLLEIDERNKKAEYYICIDSSVTGKGIGTISTKLLLEYAFKDLDLNKVYLYTEKDNENAQHLFEKIGFIKEGLLKNDIIYNDRLVSRYAYGICKDDYNEKYTNS